MSKGHSGVWNRILRGRKLSYKSLFARQRSAKEPRTSISPRRMLQSVRIRVEMAPGFGRECFLCIRRNQAAPAVPMI